MKQCLRITFSMDVPEDFFQGVVQKSAQQLGLEGTVQRVNDESIKIIICGKHEAVDEFIGHFHKAVGVASVENFQIEPFIKEKDYRGVFRVIE